MGLKELEQLLELATKYGVVKLKTSEVEIELGPSAKTEMPLPKLPEPEISKEDMLFWSVEAPAYKDDKIA